MSNAGFVGLEIAIARDKVFINLGELSGNIWTMRYSSDRSIARSTRLRPQTFGTRAKLVR